MIDNNNDKIRLYFIVENKIKNDFLNIFLLNLYFSLFTGDCSQKSSLSQMSESIKLDDSLYSIFRLDAKPIPCPFQEAPFTFSYSRGHGDCQAPGNQAESCTDKSKLIDLSPCCLKGCYSSSVKVGDTAPSLLAKRVRVCSIQ